MRRPSVVVPATWSNSDPPPVWQNNFAKAPVSFSRLTNCLPERLRNAMQSTPTSDVLEGLVKCAPAGEVTLGWLLDNLRTRSFGIVLLLLGIVGLLPVVSPAAGVLLVIPAFQMIRARSAPVFPRKVARRPLSTDSLTSMVKRVTPTLRYLERFVRPRWPTPFEVTKRVIGLVVLLLGLGFFAPIPLSNIPVGVAVILVAFAYLEEDGVLLAAALALSFMLLAIGAVALWGSIAATQSLTG
jgi:hypothetical protein